MNLIIALAATVLGIALLARFLPRTTLYRRFVLSTDIPSGPSLHGEQRDFSGEAEVARGAEGTAVTMLRPSGKARFGDHIVDVVTEGEFISAESAVQVISTDGMRVVVKAVG